MLDHNNIDLLENTTIDLDHNKLVPFYNNLLDMDNDTELDSYDCYNLTMETKVLHLAVNEDLKGKQLQQELMLDHEVLLPNYHYNDNIEQHDKKEVLSANEEGVGQTTTKRHVRRMKQVYSFARTTTQSC